jgi:Zn-dependent protease
MFNFNLTELLTWIPAVLIALTFHEYAHAKVADMLGDHTARDQGRLSLNPLVHLDPIGTLLLVVAHFGWAKPVQINPLNFKGDRRRGMILVGLAGPMMNLLVAFTTILIISLAFPGGLNSTSNVLLTGILQGIVWINIYLAVFNLIPVPPLDGSQVLAAILNSSELIYQLQRYSFIILIVLIFSGVINLIMVPLANYIYLFLATIVQFIATPVIHL